MSPTLGVLGGGQLGRMLALAGLPLGVRFRFLDPVPDAPARDTGPLIVAPFDDPEALARFADGLDAATFEFENVPADAAEFLTAHTRVHPPAAALAIAQDRGAEKAFFEKCGIPVPPYALVGSVEQLRHALRDIGLPAVLKTCRLGYDGKGQAVLRSARDGEEAWPRLGCEPCIVEALIPFEREVSVIAARARSGEFACYPPTENVHEGGILRVSRAPADVPAPLAQEAEREVRRMMEMLGYVGVLAVEFFEHEGRLLANEMACRVHNSGHWTIEGAKTSQFENHVRAVLGWPLGSTEPLGHSVMVNLIGAAPPVPEMLRIPGAHVHLYGKEPRPGRKIGHVTFVGETAHQAEEAARRLRSTLPD